MKLLDYLIAFIGLVTFWLMVYVVGIDPLFQVIAARQDHYAAQQIAGALIERYRADMMASQCPTEPTGVTIQSLIDDGYIQADTVTARQFTPSFQYVTGTVSIPGQPSWPRVNGITVSLTYNTEENAADVAGYIRYTALNGNTISFYNPITYSYSPRLLSHVDPDTGCARKLND